MFTHSFKITTVAINTIYLYHAYLPRLISSRFDLAYREEHRLSLRSVLITLIESLHYNSRALEHVQQK